MALKKCKECGEEVSSEEKACPKCGAPVPILKPWLRIIGGIIVFLIVVSTFTEPDAITQLLKENLQVLSDIYKELTEIIGGSNKGKY